MTEANHAVLNRDDAAARRREFATLGVTVVFTNGCYDLLHPGHLRLLADARRLGGALFVGINSDESIRRLKGPSRPILPEGERAEVLAALRMVDVVTVFDEDTPAELIAALLPDVLVKGADWAHLVVGRDTVERAGGRVVLLPLVDGFSTTDIIARVQAAAD